MTTAGGGLGSAKILTLWEPYATCVALGWKPHETRGWSTTYRGPLLVHAAKAWGRERRRDWRRLAEALAELGHVLPDRPCLGRVVAVCRLASCLPMAGVDPTLFPDHAKPESRADELSGDWRPGRFALRLEDVVRLPEPVAWVGSQGRPRNVPPLLLEEVERQLAAVRNQGPAASPTPATNPTND